MWIRFSFFHGPEAVFSGTWLTFVPLDRGWDKVRRSHESSPEKIERWIMVLSTPYPFMTSSSPLLKERGDREFHLYFVCLYCDHGSSDRCR